MDPIRGSARVPRATTVALYRDESWCGLRMHLSVHHNQVPVLAFGHVGLVDVAASRCEVGRPSTEVAGEVALIHEYEMSESCLDTKLVRQGVVIRGRC